MGDKVGGLAEGFAAVVTFVRLLSYIRRHNESRLKLFPIMMFSINQKNIFKSKIMYIK